MKTPLEECKVNLQKFRQYHWLGPDFGKGPFNVAQKMKHMIIFARPPSPPSKETYQTLKLGNLPLPPSRRISSGNIELYERPLRAIPFKYIREGGDKKYQKNDSTQYLFTNLTLSTSTIINIFSYEWNSQKCQVAFFTFAPGHKIINERHILIKMSKGSLSIFFVRRVLTRLDCPDKKKKGIWGYFLQLDQFVHTRVRLGTPLARC